jgi:hypothetical protein
MTEKYAGFKEIANTELTRRRTFEKTSSAYAISQDIHIVKQAEDYVASHGESDDPMIAGRVDGYRDFLRNLGL